MTDHRLLSEQLNSVRSDLFESVGHVFHLVITSSKTGE